MNAFRKFFELEKSTATAPSVPADLHDLWVQAEVWRDGKDTSWFDDKRLQNALLYVLEGHTVNGKKKKRMFGDVLLAVHLMGCAHLAFNFPGLERQAREKKLLQAYKAVIHDAIEDPRSFAKEAGTPLSSAALVEIERKVCFLWGNPKDYASILRTLTYSTDDENLHGKARIQAQIDKSFCRTTGVCIIGEDEQAVRTVDKVNQVDVDTLARAAGKLPDDKLKAQIEKAEQKDFFTRFPIVAAHPEIEKKYRENIQYLKDELRLVLERNAKMDARLAELCRIPAKGSSFQLADYGLEARRPAGALRPVPMGILFSYT